MKFQMLEYNRDGDGNFVANLSITSDTDTKLYTDYCNLNSPQSRKRFIKYALEEVPQLDKQKLQDEIAGFLKQIQKRWKNKYVYFDKNGEPHINSEELLRDIRLDFSFKTLRDTEEVLIYKDGEYYFGGEIFIKEEMEKRIDYPMLVTTHYTNEMVDRVRRNTYIDREQFSSDKWILNLENGLFNIQTMEFTAHTPEFLSLTRIPIKYNPEADCPRIRQFFTEVLNAEDIPVIQELFGYCLIPDYWIQKAFLFIGDGANGKSTMIELLRSFLGRENCSAVPIQSLNQSRFFHIADLFGKLANLYADLPSQCLKYTGPFKMLTGGDTVPGEYKFKNIFHFVNHAKLIYSANRPPEVVGEDSYAFWRRWIIIAYPNSFPEDSEETDKHIMKKLTKEGELSGLLNIVLPKIIGLWESGRFSYKRTVEEVTEYYMKASDPIYAFLTDKCEINLNGWVSKDELFQAFVEYCQANNIPIPKPNSFARGLQNQIFIRVKSSRHRVHVGGKQIPTWDGVEFKKDSEDSEVSPYLKAVTKNNKDSKNNNNTLGRGKNVTILTQSETEQTLGMSIDHALNIWRSRGAPIIHLSPGENIEELDLFFYTRDIKCEHLEVIKKWLSEHTNDLEITKDGEIDVRFLGD